MGRDLDWGQAPCCQPGVDANLWHDRADISPPGTNPPLSAAARVCLTACPTALREACLRQAMADERDKALDSRFGVFGGATPRQRFELWERLNPERAEEARERSRQLAAARAQPRQRRAGPAAA